MVRRWAIAGVALGVIAPAAHAATITVNTTQDVIGADGKCSLREAITAANTDRRSGSSPGECPAGHGTDLIVLPAGRYVLSIGGPGDDQNAGGDLDVRSDLALRGAGARTTTIDANGLDRVLDITFTTAHVRLQGLTLTGGRAPADGSGAAGQLRTSGVNRGEDGAPSQGSTGSVGEGGGAIRSEGTLTVVDCAITGNRAGNGGRGGTGGPGGSAGPSGTGGNSVGGEGGQGGPGGGIDSTGPLTIVGSTIRGNSAGSGGPGGSGGVAASGGDGVSGSVNGGKGGWSEGGFGGTGGSGGGIAATARLVVVHSTISANRAGDGGRGGNAGVAGAGGKGASGGGGENGGNGGDGGVGFGGDGGLGGDGGGIDALGTTAIDTSALIGNRAGDGGSAGSSTDGGRGGNGGAGALGGSGGAGGESTGGAASRGGWGGGVYALLHLTMTDSTAALNDAGSGGLGGIPGTGGAGGTGGISGGTTGSGGQGGGGGGSVGGPGGSGGEAGGIGATNPTIINATISGNRAGSGSPGGTGGLGGAGGNGGRGLIEGGNGGGGGPGLGDFGGGGGDGGGVNGGKLVQVTVAGNAAGKAGAPGGAGTGGPGGLGGAQTGGGPAVGQHGGQGSAAPAFAAPNGVGGGALGVSLTNSLIANNSPSNCDGAVTDRGHNLEFPASGCPGKVANPRLGPLQDNGGPAPTIALGSGSAALDAIPVNVSGCTNTDERGVRRPQGRACDIGAYEREAPVVVTRAPAHVTTKTAVLRGTVTPNAYGFAHFELIGPSGAIRRTGTVVLTGLKLLALTVRATGLTPGTRYRYRLVLERFDGTTSGAVRSFRTRRPRRRPR